MGNAQRTDDRPDLVTPELTAGRSWINDRLPAIRLLPLAILCLSQTIAWSAADDEPVIREPAINAQASDSQTLAPGHADRLRPRHSALAGRLHASLATDPMPTCVEAELQLHLKSDLFGDRDGSRVVVPGDLAASQLWRRLTSDDPSERMPPADSEPNLSAAQIQLIGRWIKAGAPWSGHWSFEPPDAILGHRHPVTAGLATAIDRFIAKPLGIAGLQPSPETDKADIAASRYIRFDRSASDNSRDLINTRRINFPARTNGWVDRLLGSPRYGEHMARAWLDAARYADTDGYQNDRTRYMSPWRDWVIMAMNQNMPYDQFTIEQLAGDMLPDATLYQQVATGFGRNHRINSEGGSIPAEWAAEYVVDRVDTLGTIWLGLTVGCARCHDHKYDPISQREYYRLFAFFNNVPEWGLGPNNGNSPPFIKIPKAWPHLGRRRDAGD